MSTPQTDSSSSLSFMNVSLDDIPFIDEEPKVVTKVNQPTKASRITVVVDKRNDLKIVYSISKEMEMKKLKDHYAKQVNIPVENMCFLFYEKLVADNHTAKSLAMPNNSIIKAFEVKLQSPNLYCAVENNKFV